MEGIASYIADIEFSYNRGELSVRYISVNNALRVMAIRQNTPFCINTFNIPAGLSNP